jgi:PAS domain S-box-containing protein
MERAPPADADRYQGLDAGLDPILDAAPCGYVAFADDGTIRLVNQTLLELLGYSRSDLTGRHVETIFAVGTRIFYQTHLFPLLRLHGYANEIFLLLRQKPGTDVGVLANAVRRQRDGEWISECVLMHVIERRKFEEELIRARNAAEQARLQAEAHRRELEAANDLLERQAVELEATQQQLLDQATELERQRAAAEEANRAKSTFLAMMSHELRTPLNAIGGYVQLLEMELHGPVNEQQAEALRRIQRAQRHLLRLINDVLNLARIEAGRVDYRLERVDLRELVDAVFPMVEPQFAAKEIRYARRIPEALAVHSDRDKVEQILLNLLSNAAKFTPPGGLVEVEVFDNARRTDIVHLRVRDTGIGIPRDRLEQVFEPFVQVDVSHARRSEGTGLGLAISRDLARLMGGDLRVRSEVGVGTSFTLTLPRYLAQARV